jgi:hypothetical protein
MESGDRSQESECCELFAGQYLLGIQNTGTIQSGVLRELLCVGLLILCRPAFTQNTSNISPFPPCPPREYPFSLPKA